MHFYKMYKQDIGQVNKRLAALKNEASKAMQNYRGKMDFIQRKLKDVSLAIAMKYNK